MKQITSRTLLTIVLFAASAGRSFGGAWTAPEGSFYEKLGFNYYYSSDTFSSSGNRRGTPNNGKFTDYDISNYFEYGLTNDLTAINALTYKARWAAVSGRVAPG